MIPPKIDPIVPEFRQALRPFYGNRRHNLIVFDSSCYDLTSAQAN